MIPILYKSDEIRFNHNGLGLLSETLECTVTEERNGQFELFLEYPVGGRLYEEIKDFVIIKAKPNRLDDEDHLFRVYDHEMDISNQTVLVYAHSKTNDLAGNMVLEADIINQNAQEALNSMKSNLIEPTDYIFHSDITTRSSTKWERRNPLNCIVGEQGSLVQYWGGEIKRRNEVIHLYRRRGNDNVTTIRHGKNLTGLKVMYSTKGMVTKILPVCTFTEEETDEEITLVGDAVESQYVNNYPIKFIKEIDFSNDEIRTVEQLNNAAEGYFERNTGIDLPKIKMEVDMDDLSDSPEYAKFKDLERIELTDTVTVYAEKFRVHITARINKMVFNVLTEKVEKLDIGSVQSKLFDDIERNIREELESVNKEIETVHLAANNKNRVYKSTVEPKTGLKNDIWYKPVGDGEVEMYIHDGTSWGDPEAQSADQLRGTFNAANINVINLNANSMTTGNLRGGNVDFNLDEGTFLIGESPTNPLMWFNGTNLVFGEDIKLNWGQIEDVEIDWNDIENPPLIPDEYTDLQAVNAWARSNYSTYIDSGGVYTGTVMADQIYANTLSAITANLGTVTAGEITSNTTINVATDIYVGNNMYLGNFADSNVKTIYFNDAANIRNGSGSSRHGVSVHAESFTTDVANTVIGTYSAHTAFITGRLNINGDIDVDRNTNISVSRNRTRVPAGSFGAYRMGNVVCIYFDYDPSLNATGWAQYDTNILSLSNYRPRNNIAGVAYPAGSASTAYPIFPMITSSGAIGVVNSTSDRNNVGRWTCTIMYLAD